MLRKQRTRIVCVFAGDATVCSIWDMVGCISVSLTHIDPNQIKTLFGSYLKKYFQIISSFSKYFFPSECLKAFQCLLASSVVDEQWVPFCFRSFAFTLFCGLSGSLKVFSLSAVCSKFLVIWFGIGPVSYTHLRAHET